MFVIVGTDEFQLVLESVQWQTVVTQGYSDRLFHTDGPQEAKLRCATDVCTRDSWMQPVDAGRIAVDHLGRCLPGHRAFVNVLRRHSGGTSNSDRTLKNNFLSHWKPMEAVADWRDVAAASSCWDFIV